MTRYFQLIYVSLDPVTVSVLYQLIPAEDGAGDLELLKKLLVRSEISQILAMGYLEGSWSSQRQLKEQGAYLGHTYVKEKGSLQMLERLRRKGHNEPRLVTMCRSLFFTGNKGRKYVLVVKPGLGF